MKFEIAYALDEARRNLSLAKIFEARGDQKQMYQFCRQAQAHLDRRDELKLARQTKRINAVKTFLLAVFIVAMFASLALLGQKMTMMRNVRAEFSVKQE